MEEEKESKKKLDFVYIDLRNKFESEKSSLAELINQKKDLNEAIINLEKQVNFRYSKKVQFKVVNYLIKLDFV